MVKELSKIVSSIEPSATLEINTKIREMEAAGNQIVGFGMGELDFETPDYIVQAAKQALDNPLNLRYSSANGLLELRELIAQKTSITSKIHYTPKNVVVTNGAKQSMANVFASICDPGDEVILPSPYWLSYKECVKLAHAVPVSAKSTLDENYRVTVEQLEEVLTPKTKVLVIVSPQNPTGTVLNEQDLAAIGEFALKNDLWVIADEIYEHYVYDNLFPTKQAPSLLSVVPELKNQTVILNGVSKTFAMTGWRVGWAVGPEKIIDYMQNIQSQVVSNVFAVAQIGALAAVKSEQEKLGQDFIEKGRTELENRRNVAYNILSNIPNIKVNKPQGAFYFLINIEKVCLENETTSKFLADLLEQKKVAMVPGEGFDAPKHVRISYAVNIEKMSKGLNLFAEFISERQDLL